MSTVNERYARQMQLPGFGAAGQEALGRSHVAVVGAGGLGSPALLYLAAAGVGRITIIDDDVVDLSNLHRQVLHTTSRVGVPKVDSAREAIAELNPCVEVEVVRGRLTWPNAPHILRGADVVLDGADNFETRHVVSASCARLGIPHVWGAILGWEAQLSFFHAGHAPIYEDLFPSPPPPGSVPSCAQAGVLGPVVGVVGSAMALEAITYLCGCGRTHAGRVAVYDAWRSTWSEIPLHRDPAVTKRIIEQGPPLPTPVPTTTEIPPEATLIDVREPEEFAAGSIPGAQNIPLSRIRVEPGEVASQVQASQTAVLFCQRGSRSKDAIRLLQECDESSTTTPRLLSLHGGYEGWMQRGGSR